MNLFNLRTKSTIFGEAGLDVVVVVVPVRRNTNQTADTDAEVAQSSNSETESVDLLKGDGDRLQPAVEYSVDEGNVQVEGKNNGLGQGEGERLDQSHLSHVGTRHVFTHNLRLALDLVVGLAFQTVVLLLPFAKTVRATVQDVVRRGLGEKEDQEDEARARNPDEDPDRPSPAFELSCPITDDRTNGGAHDVGDTVDGESVGALGRWEDVCQRSASSSENGGTEETSQETEGEQHADVLCIHNTKVEEHKDD